MNFAQMLSNEFMPHGHCYYWQPGLLWTHVVSDALIALAYFSIPVTMLYFLGKRPEIRFAWMVWLFASFIVLCGITHVFGIITIWNPVYPMEASLKTLCALVSVITAIALIPLVPRALSLRSAKELEDINQQLMREIAARKKAEQALARKITEFEQSNRQLEQFAYVASHDLQAPLRSIVGFATLLERKNGDVLDEDSKEYIGFVKQGGQNMQRLVQDLLELSRVTSASKPFARVRVKDAVNQACGALSQDISDADAQIVTHDLPVILADAGQLVQLFQNLIGNAIKFRRKGEQPIVEVKAKRNGEAWNITITDNGIGIPEEHRDDIFAIFRRLHTNDEFEGTGIGLALCATIVQRHRGTISIEQAPGSGSRFVCTFPVMASERSNVDQYSEYGINPLLS